MVCGELEQLKADAKSGCYLRVLKNVNNSVGWVLAITALPLQLSLYSAEFLGQVSSQLSLFL